MHINIIEQSKEIGVLRCLGLTKWETSRLYIYEGFILIVASSILGGLNGVIVGYTMCAQVSMFVNLPIVLAFPVRIIFVIICGAIISTIVAIMVPMKKFLFKPVSNVLRVSL